MNGTSSTTATGTVSETEDRFMKLLVAQMKNQDPLNPLDNAQVTSQLAQLSTVSGINQLNTTLEAFQSSMQASQTLQSANMIGHGVFVPGTTLSLASSQSIFGVSLSGAADTVKVTIRDASGNALKTMNLGAKSAGVVALTWDGLTDAGVTAADGIYAIEVAAASAGQKVDATGLSFGQVASVTAGASGAQLNVQDVGAVNLSDVVQIY